MEDKCIKAPKLLSIIFENISKHITVNVELIVEDRTCFLWLDVELLHCIPRISWYCQISLWHSQFYAKHLQ